MMSNITDNSVDIAFYDFLMGAQKPLQLFGNKVYWVSREDYSIIYPVTARADCPTATITFSYLPWRKLTIRANLGSNELPIPQIEIWTDNLEDEEVDFKIESRKEVYTSRFLFNGEEITETEVEGLHIIGNISDSVGAQWAGLI